MIPTDEIELRKEFKSILIELSNPALDMGNKSQRVRIYLRLENLYGKNQFRHFYSDIFSVLSQIQNGSVNGDINTLAQNIGLIRSGYQSINKNENGDCIDIAPKIRKLDDHLNLEIGRMSFYTSIQESAKIKDSLIEMKNLARKTTDSMRRQQSEYIAILGIFASIVIAFTGGMTFSTSVLENIANTSAYRIITVALIIGIIFCNAIFGLFCYIGSIVKNRSTIKPLVISNIILVILLSVSVFAWKDGWIENRNLQFDTKASYTMDSEQSELKEPQEESNQSIEASTANIENSSM